MKKFILASLVCSTVAFYSCDQKHTETDTAANQNGDDAVEQAEDMNEDKMKGDKEDAAEFMVWAADGGMAEVELGKLAAEKATDAEVKQFGQMMVTDHTKANEELKALAAKMNVTLPATTGEENKEHYNKLASLKGADFDKAYIDMMVEDHEKDVKKFKEEAGEDDNADVKALAAKTVPVLEHHLEMVKKIDARLDAKH